jgi:uncharacterized SAM-binding protein YcdF (DUF218 family)
MTQAGLVVLGAKLGAGGAAGPALLRRAEAAARAWAGGGYAVVVVTGGPPVAEPSEAAVLRAELVARGVPEAAILLEPRARSTFENAAFAIPLLRARGIARVAVVSDAYHLPRAMIVMRALGMPASGIAAERPGPPDRARRAAELLREAAALPGSAARALVWRLAQGPGRARRRPGGAEH